MRFANVDRQLTPGSTTKWSRPAHDLRRVGLTIGRKPVAPTWAIWRWALVRGAAAASHLQKRAYLLHRRKGPLYGSGMTTRGRQLCSWHQRARRGAAGHAVEVAGGQRLFRSSPRSDLSAVGRPVFGWATTAPPAAMPGYGRSSIFVERELWSARAFVYWPHPLDLHIPFTDISIGVTTVAMGFIR